MKISNLNPVSRQSVFRSTPVQPERAFCDSVYYEAVLYCKKRCTWQFVLGTLLQTDIPDDRVPPASWRRKRIQLLHCREAYRDGTKTGSWSVRLAWIQTLLNGTKSLCLNEKSTLDLEFVRRRLYGVQSPITENCWTCQYASQQSYGNRDP